MNTSVSDWSCHHTVAEDSAVLECYSASGNGLWHCRAVRQSARPSWRMRYVPSELQ